MLENMHKRTGTYQPLIEYFITVLGYEEVAQGSVLKIYSSSDVSPLGLLCDVWWPWRCWED